MAAGLPHCLRAVAAAELAVLASREFVGYSDLEQVCTPRPDLLDTPLENCDNVLFVDGSASKDPQTGLNKVGFAVTTEFEVVKSGKLPSNYSAQAAELVALTEACKLMADKCVTIYTDSRYAFGVTHDFGALWKHRNFLKSDGHPILNASLVSELLEAILLPDEVAICKCAAHTNDISFISTGNARADAAAKAVAAQETKETTCALVSVTNPDISPCLQSRQTFSTGAEKLKWRSSGCSLQGGVWMSVDDIPCLPKHFFQHYAKLTHGLDHVSKGSMIMQMKELWFTKGFTVFAEFFCKRCSDNGRHFVNDAIKQVGQFLGIDMRTHCSYAPSSGGAVERQNQTIKNKLAKCCEETGLTWLKALPIVLMYMRMRKRVKTNLSPFEILFGRPPFMGIEGGKQRLPSTDVCENDMLNYCKEMSCLLSNISVQVKAAQGKVAETFLHEVRPGDFVVIRDHRRKSWKSKRWLGPFQVLLVTHTAVKVAERATWVHVNHCRRVPPIAEAEQSLEEVQRECQ